ncbi:hypothetical protein CULT_630002 [[Clostridium] ultunense Esp]|nr:hypothetical protein CULT_630002 [[Clostridium] ultunense Esp]
MAIFEPPLFRWGRRLRFFADTGLRLISPWLRRGHSLHFDNVRDAAGLLPGIGEKRQVYFLIRFPLFSAAKPIWACSSSSLPLRNLTPWQDAGFFVQVYGEKRNLEQACPGTADFEKKRASISRLIRQMISIFVL